MSKKTKDIEAHAVSRSDADAVNGEDVKHEAFEQRNVGTLDRRLKSRHVQFLALSGMYHRLIERQQVGNTPLGAIGTGLFVGSGQVLSLAGPLSAFLSYTITGFNLYCVINSLGEMGTYLPIPGAVPVFAARYVDEALGFTLGWNYYYQLAVSTKFKH